MKITEGYMPYLNYKTYYRIRADSAFVEQTDGLAERKTRLFALLRYDVIHTCCFF